MTDPRRDPLDEILKQIAEAMARETDRLMLGGSPKPTKENGGFLIPFGAVWTKEDEPMTDLVEPFIRGYPVTRRQAECDCPNCTARVEEERRMWAGVGIDVFGEVE